jgi:outer membrane protein
MKRIFLVVFFLTAAVAVALSAAQAQTGNGSLGNGQPVLTLIPAPTTYPLESANAHSLSLDDAIKLAIQQNYTVANANFDVQNAEYEQRRQKDALLPDLNFTAGYGYNYTINPPEFFGTASPNAGNNLSYRLGSTFNIYNGGSDAARIRSAGYSLDAYRSTFTWTRQQTAFLVVNDYVNALRFRELVRSAQKTLAESQADLLRQQGLNQAGSTTLQAVYQQQAVVGQNELSLIQSENNYENAKADLLFALNVAPSEYQSYSVNLLGIDTSTSGAARFQADTALVPQAIDRIIQSRPDFVSARVRIQSNEAAVEAIHGLLLPRLDLNAGLGGSGSSSTMFKIAPQNAFSAGLSLTVPLFDRFQNRLQIDEQNVIIEQNRIRLTQLEQQLRSDVAKSVNNLRFAGQGLDASNRSLVAAEENMRFATERLRVGAGIQLDVYLAETQLETARINQVNAVFNYVLAQKQLQYNLGQWNY